MPGAPGVCTQRLGAALTKPRAAVRAPRHAGGEQRRRRTHCRGSREPYETNSGIPYFLKSKVESIHKEWRAYVSTLTRQADSITSIFWPSSEDDARDMILMSVSFVALVWLSMELVRLYLFWYEAAGLKTIAQMLQEM